ncbi:FUSC family protein [Corynebacterium camporealensis]|uniref:aromatic acid exporter family protein n=1 Tax=Corynebacterium camporealensis TaxID=161896 RepID=UPI0034CFC7F1
MAEHKTRQATRERLRALDRGLLERVNRVRSRLVFILQATIAAGLAYWVAHVVFGHAQPFFAPMSVVIILGLNGSDRVNRAVEMAIGGIVGVALGDLLFQVVGQGPFQITVTVGIALIAGSFLSKSPLVVNQITIGTILIATILPPTEGAGGLERAIDALIGSAIGIATIALIPNSPLTPARREISKVLGIASAVLWDVSRGLRDEDSEAIRDAREAIRGSQSNVNSLLSAAKSSRETASVSPLLWGNRRTVSSFERVLTPVDDCIRNVRVLSRRALVLIEDDDTVSEKQIEAIEELSDIANTLSDLYADKAHRNQGPGPKDEAHKIPELVHRLRIVGGTLSMDLIEDEGVLASYAILAQTRSIVVDLLMVCGMSRESAVAVLIPTSENPAYPPEIWEEHDE